MPEANPKIPLPSTGETKRKENRAWRVSRKPVSAELLSPAVRAIAHDTFVVRPNTDAIAQQHGNRRADIQDAVSFEIHRRLARVESLLGFPAGEAVPSARQAVMAMRRNVA